MSELKINKRDNKICNSARKARSRGMVPGVIYGKKAVNLLFEVGALELDKEISNNGEHGILSINIDGEEKKALIKEVQREPVKHNIIHLDLEQIEENKKIETDVPIKYTGEGYLESRGAVLQKEKDLVRVSCEVDKLPKSIEINVSNGVNGSVYRLTDIEVGSEISIIEDLNTVIASISNEKKLVADVENEKMLENIEKKKEENK